MRSLSFAAASAILVGTHILGAQAPLDPPGRVTLGEPVVFVEATVATPPSDPAPLGGCSLEQRCLFSAVPTHDQVWFQVDYIHRWIRGAGAPTLLTTDPTGGATPTAGGLADPGTRVIIDGDVSPESLASLRLEGGVALAERLGLEVSAFFTEDASRTQAVAGDANGAPFLFRPFFNADTGNANAGSNVSWPALVTGGVSVTGTTQVWGIEGRLTRSKVERRDLRIDVFTGVRYLDLDERIDILDARTDLAGIGNFAGPVTAPGDRFFLHDRFRTRNQFVGGLLGVRGEVTRGRFVFGGSAGVALGSTRQQVDVSGGTTLSPLGGSTAFIPGGILSLPSNSGTSDRYRFTAVPEVRVQIGYDLTSWLRLGVNYEFLYWSDVTRPGTQIGSTVSTAQMPSSPNFGAAATPIPTRRDEATDFWMHGLGAFARIRY